MSHFEFLHDWIRPPDGLRFGDTHGLCQDSAGLIYLAHTVHPGSARPEAIVVYTQEGNFVRAFGTEFRGGAHGIAVRRERDGEYLYHCDVVRCEVIKTDLTGRIIWRSGYPVGLPEYGNTGSPFVPTNVAFLEDDRLLVADGYGSFHITELDRDGRFIGTVVKAGDTEGGLRVPHGLCIVDGRLLIADRGHFRLLVYSLAGEHLQTISVPQIRRPCHFDLRDGLIVCPDLDSQVLLMSAANFAVLDKIGDGQAGNGDVGSRRNQARHQFTPGSFISPHAAIILQSGDILVAEWLPIGRVTLVRRRGR